jgi:magnesium-transporting ATPase (P-type)
MSMTILVIVEMFNALNALSENGSLLNHTPSSNLWLIGAITISILLHIAVLYVPWLAAIFSVVPLAVHEWLVVIYLSFPVIFVDEVLKLITRKRGGIQRTASRKGNLLPRSIKDIHEI